MNKELVSSLFKTLMEEGLGLDLSDPNLTDTPNRVAKMYCDELFSGLKTKEPKTTVFPNTHQYSQMVLSDKIYFSSMCSHHFLPFSGYAWVMYIPGESLLGLSKFSRIVNWYASRPQLQEQLTHDVVNFLVEKLQPIGVMVVIRALHQCMHCRGVKQHSGAGMVTSAIYGAFEKPEVRSEGMDLIKLSMV
jgi:GTP cyclohydrolase IA